MKTKNPSEFITYLVDFFFDEKNQILNATGFNPECIMEIDFKIMKHGYKIIRDLYQQITREQFEYFLEKNKSPQNCWAVINDLLLVGASSTYIQSLNPKESHKLHNEETGKDYYTTASRI